MAQRIVWMLFVLLVGSVFVVAESGNHYPNGVEGIKAASVPPPGTYLRTYVFFYHAGRVNDGDGNQAPVGFSADVLAIAPRLIWVTDHKLLGADVAFDVMLPFIYTGLSIDQAHLDESTFGVSDLYFSPLILAWHKPRFDAALGFSVFAPTGSWSATNPSKPGKNYWTSMITAGGTAYFDANKLWAGSLLARYEFHSDRRKVDVNLGDDFHCEWSVSRSFHKTMDLGLVGYIQTQVTQDSGKDVTWNPNVKDRAFAVGGEYSNVFPKSKFIFSVRALKEFGVRDRPQGFVLNTTLTKIF